MRTLYVDLVQLSSTLRDSSWQLVLECLSPSDGTNRIHGLLPAIQALFDIIHQNF